MSDKRYFLDIRSGCAAVRDSYHPKHEKGYPGLHHDTIDVVEYRHGFRSEDGWAMKQSDIDYLTELCNKLNMTPKLPEGSRILKDEKTGERFVWKTGRVQGEPMGGTYPVGDIIEPYVERLPLFTDPMGNPVFRGDKTWAYEKEEQKYYESAPWGCLDKEHNNWSPSFKHKSDCEKWVASNVKTMTREEALRMAAKLIWDFRAGPCDISSYEDYCEMLIKETCLLTSVKD